MISRARFATSLAALLAVIAPMRGAHALETPTPAPCTPTFRFASSTYSATEEQGVVTLTVQRECLGQATSVNYSTANITATSGSDYTGVAGTLNFAASDTSKTIDVLILNDTVAEAGETFRVTLSGSGITSPDQTTVTILDGVPTVSISASPASGSESDEPTAKFTVSLTASSSSNVSVPISLSGTATRYATNLVTNPSLESASTGWSMNSNASDADFTRSSEDSFFGAYAAKFTATTANSGYWIIPSYSFSPEIPVGGFSTSQQYSLSFYAKANAARSLTLQIADANGSNVVKSLGEVVLTPAWKRYTYTFTPSGNGAYPSLRFLTYSDDLPLTLYIDGLKLEPGSSATRFGDYEFFGQNLISNSDLESAATNWALNSGGGDGTFSRVNTTAYSGSYSAKFTATTFSSWLIPTYALWSDIHPDGLSTTDQYVLSYYAKMDAARTLTGTIGNGNGSAVIAYFGELEFGTSWKRYEYFFTPPISGAPINYPGIKLEALSNDVPFTLYWDKLQLQKVSPLTTVTFAAGETVKTLEMPVIDDRIYEAGETIIVDLLTPVGADLNTSQATATYTIDGSGDQPTVSIQGPPLTLEETFEGLPTSAGIAINLSHGNTEVPVSVPIACTGTAQLGIDYTFTPSGQIDFPAGQSAGEFFIETIDDHFDEPDETIIATLGSSSSVSVGNPSSAQVTIHDDNDPPTINMLVEVESVPEEIGALSITAELSSTHPAQVQVAYATSNGSATAGADYTATSGILTFDPGETTASFQVSINRDCLAESDENFTVTLSDPVNGVLGNLSQYTYLIEDPPVTFEIIPNGSWSPYISLTYNIPGCVDTNFRFEYRIVSNPASPGPWTSCNLRGYPDDWTESDGCGNRGLTWDLDNLAATEAIEVHLIYTVEGTPPVTVTGSCGPMGEGVLHFSDVQKGKREAPPTCAFPAIPTATAAAVSPTVTPNSSGDYMRAKYLSVGSAYQLKPADLDPAPAGAGSTLPPNPKIPATAVSPQYASALVSQAVYGDGNGLWNGDETAEFSDRNVRMLGGSIATDWGMKDVGPGVSYADDSVAIPTPIPGPPPSPAPTPILTAIDNKYMLATQTLASLLRGGTIYDSIRAVSRHSIGMAAIANGAGNFVHTIQGSEVRVYSMAPSAVTSKDARDLPLEPDPSKPPEVSDGAAGVAYNVGLSLDNAKDPSISVENNSSNVTRPGGMMGRVVGIESIISSNGNSDSAYEVNEAAGMLIRNTFGLPGVKARSDVQNPEPALPFTRKYNVAKGVEVSVSDPRYDQITGPLNNALLIRPQGSTQNSLGSANREVSTLSLDAKPNSPEASANIVAADSCLFGDGKSDLRGFSTDTVTLGGPLTLGPATEALGSICSDSLPISDRIGLIVFDSSSSSLRLSVADSQSGGSVPTWAALKLEDPIAPVAANTLLRGKLEILDKSFSGVGLPQGVASVSINSATVTIDGIIGSPQIELKHLYWRTLPYGRSGFGGRPWKSQAAPNFTPQSAGNGRLVVTLSAFLISVPLAADGTNTVDGQVLEVLCLMSAGGVAVATSDTIRLEESTP